jgi:hypothetical protein
LTQTQQGKITGEWRKTIGTCAAAIVFEVKMLKETVGILAKTEEWCNKKVQISRICTY